jgi:hypothetical protein
MKDKLILLFTSMVFVLMLYALAIPLSYLIQSLTDFMSPIPIKSWLVMFPIMSVIVWVSVLIEV